MIKLIKLTSPSSQKSRKASIDETYFPSKPVPPGFQGSYHCEQGGIFLFKPNAEVFRDFPSFLRVVEEIAGRERGLVKIMIPDEWYLLSSPADTVRQ